MKMKFVMVAVLFSFLAGCVTPPPALNPEKPVVFYKGFFEPSLRQDGLVIDDFTAMNRFSEIPEAKSSAENARVLFWATVLTSAVGGWFVGTYLGQKDKKTENIAVGGGLIGLAVLLGHYQKSELGQAADVYNSDLKNRKKSAFTVEPAVAPVAGGGMAGVLIGY